MNAIIPAATTLSGRYIQLEPLTLEHLPLLHPVIGQPSVFAGGFGGGLSNLQTDAATFVDWAAGYYQWSGLPYAVRLTNGPNAGTLVGTTGIGEISVQNESVHVGWTAYDPRVWGTAVNAEAKLLLFTTAFDNGFGRVRIQADGMNTRSRAAILGLGATFEGLLRRERRRPDGSWRDTALYSVLSEEWPRVRAGLQSRLDFYDGAPVRFRDLSPLG